MKKKQKEMYPSKDQVILDEFKVEELEERLEMTNLTTDAKPDVDVEVGVVWRF